MAIQNLVPTEGMVDGDERRTSIRPVGKEYSQIRPAAQLSVIVAADRGGAIGLRGGMLWHLPGDLRRFKAITTGKAVVMGRKTWESLPRRPLPGRLNVVITRQPGYRAEGATVVGSLREAVGVAAGSPEIFFIGGGDVYRQAMPMATRLYLTRILDRAPEADTWFPDVDPREWTLTETESVPADGPAPACRFENYVRTGRVEPKDLNDHKDLRTQEK